MLRKVMMFVLLAPHSALRLPTRLFPRNVLLMSVSSSRDASTEVPARWRSVSKGGDDPLKRSKPPEVAEVARELSSWHELLETPDEVPASRPRAAAGPPRKVTKKSKTVGQ